MGLPKVSRLVGSAMVVAAAVVGDLAVVVVEPQEVIWQIMVLGIFIACAHVLECTMYLNKHEQENVTYIGLSRFLRLKLEGTTSNYIKVDIQPWLGNNGSNFGRNLNHQS